VNLTKEQEAVLQALIAARGASFADLMHMSGLDRRTDFVGANLRGVDFGTSDLGDFNFTRADLTGADMTRASGKDRVMLADAITTGARGLPSGPFRMRDRPDLPELVRIPAGSFLMGVPAAENRREKVPKEFAAWSTPQQLVTIEQGFWLGRYPVTRGQFAAFAEATGYQTPGEAWTFEPDEQGKWDYELRQGRSWRNPGFEQTDDHPVVCVSHDDATAYLKWLAGITGHAYRLPSETEWEYAARAGATTARFWGDSRVDATRYAKVADRTLAARMNATFDPERFFDGESDHPFTAPVGFVLANPFGLSDMLGNVREWMADYWSEKIGDVPIDGSANTTGDSGRRAMRGGSWWDYPWGVCAGRRDWGYAGDRGDDTGFRVARTYFSS
jgi:formylglycine-generating enzyme required for sulfatase activity